MAATPAPQAKSPLQLKLAEDLNDAVRKGDTARRSVIRLLLSAISYAEMAQQEKLYDAAVKKGQTDIGREEIAKLAALDDGGVLVVIGKEAKKRQESIEMFKQGNRPELAAREETELAILNEYLPRQMSREDIAVEVRKVIAETGARGPADKGKVMPKLMAALKGKADGRDINAVVTELLNQ